MSTAIQTIDNGMTLSSLSLEMRRLKQALFTIATFLTWLYSIICINCKLPQKLLCVTLGSPLIDGIFLVQKMCIYSCVTLSTTLLIHAVQFNARSAWRHQCRKICIHDINIDASQADRTLNWTARINKVVDRVTQE